MSNISIFIIASFIILIIIEIFLGEKKPLRKAFCNSLLGISSLLVVNICSSFTGIALPISILSLFVSSLLGIPGVATMTILSSLTGT